MTGWPRITVDELADRVDYGLTASATWDKSGPQFLRITDIQDGSVNWRTVPHCSCTPHDLPRYSLREGDIVFARTGATTGKSYLIRTCPPGTVFASYLIRIRPSTKVDPRYLAYFFDTPDYWGQVALRAQGAGQPGINASKLKEISVPLPPLPKQRRIAAILDQADAIRRKRTETIEVGNNLVASIFHEMFGDPVTAGTKDGSVALPEVVDIFSGGTPSKSCPEYWNGGFPWVSPKDMKRSIISGAEDHITELAFEQTTLKKLPIGSVLVVVRGMILAHTFPVAITTVPVAINQDMRALVSKDHHRLIPEFLLWALRLQDRYILSLVSTAAHGTKRLETSTLCGVRIPYPSPEQQRLFAHRASQANAMSAKQRMHWQESDALFQSLVQQAFRGEL